MMNNMSQMKALYFLKNTIYTIFKCLFKILLLRYPKVNTKKPHNILLAVLADTGMEL